MSFTIFVNTLGLLFHPARILDISLVMLQSLVSITKTKKCQPAVRDTPVDGPHPTLLGVGVPDGGLACPSNKIIIKPKISVLAGHPDGKWITDDLTTLKQQKCQPAVRDTLVDGPHPSHMGVGVPDGWLARPSNKITIKPKITVRGRHPDDKWIMDDSSKQKQQKCQPAVRDTPVDGPHPTLLGVGVPDGGLARP